MSAVASPRPTAEPLQLPRLVLVTDRAQLRLGRGLVRTVSECADAGLEAVIVRELDLLPERRHCLLDLLAGIAGLTVISAHTPDPAAAGVHLPSGAGGCNAQLSPVRGRDSGSEEGITVRYMRFGRSCHTAEEVRAAADEGAQWTTLGPFAATPSKPGYGPPVAPGEYAGLPIPTLALGGITLDNARAALAAGAHGIAVMGAVMRSADPAEEVRRLLSQIAEEVAEQVAGPVEEARRA